MKNEEFLVLFDNNIGIYLFSLILSTILYLIIYRKYFISVFDPFMFQTICSSLGFAVVIFLYFTKQITTYYFSSYIFTQAAFISGIFVFKQKKRSEKRVISLMLIKDNFIWTESAFLVISSIHLILQILSYYNFGIPLFANERLSIYSEGNGIGIIGRILSTLLIFGIYLSLSVIHNTRKNSFKTLAITYLIFILVFCFLSGSRSSFLPILFVYFLYTSLSNQKNILKNIEIKIIAIIFILGVLITNIKHNSLSIAFLELFLRTIGFGDIYWAAYPNNIINQLDTTRPFTTLFADFLATFRIVSWDNIPKSLGLQLFKIHYWDGNMGPNARHNIFGLAYFGYSFSIIYSFILGLIVGLTRNLFFLKRTDGIIGMIYIFMYMTIMNMEMDTSLVIAQLTSMLITILLLIPLITLFFIIVKNEGTTS